MTRAVLALFQDLVHGHLTRGDVQLLADSSAWTGLWGPLMGQLTAAVQAAVPSSVRSVADLVRMLVSGAFLSCGVFGVTVIGRLERVHTPMPMVVKFTGQGTWEARLSQFPLVCAVMNGYLQEEFMWMGCQDSAREAAVSQLMGAQASQNHSPHFVSMYGAQAVTLGRPCTLEDLLVLFGQTASLTAMPDVVASMEQSALQVTVLEFGGVPLSKLLTLLVSGWPSAGDDTALDDTTDSSSWSSSSPASGGNAAASRRGPRRPPVPKPRGRSPAAGGSRASPRGATRPQSQSQSGIRAQLGSLVFQILQAILTMQVVTVRHNDLHLNNIVGCATTAPYLYYAVDVESWGASGSPSTWKTHLFRVPTFGIVWRVLDFGMATCTDLFGPEDHAVEAVAGPTHRTEGYMGADVPLQMFDVGRFMCSLLLVLEELTSDSSASGGSGGSAILGAMEDLQVLLQFGCQLGAVALPRPAPTLRATLGLRHPVSPLLKAELQAGRGSSSTTVAEARAVSARVDAHVQRVQAGCEDTGLVLHLLLECSRMFGFAVQDLPKGVSFEPVFHGAPSTKTSAASAGSQPRVRSSSAPFSTSVPLYNIATSLLASQATIPARTLAAARAAAVRVVRNRRSKGLSVTGDPKEAPTTSGKEDPDTEDGAAEGAVVEDAVTNRWHQAGTPGGQPRRRGGGRAQARAAQRKAGARSRSTSSSAATKDPSEPRPTLLHLHGPTVAKGRSGKSASPAEAAKAASGRVNASPLQGRRRVFSGAAEAAPPARREVSSPSRCQGDKLNVVMLKLHDWKL